MDGVIARASSHALDESLLAAAGIRELEEIRQYCSLVYQLLVRTLLLLTSLATLRQPLPRLQSA